MPKFSLQSTRQTRKFQCKFPPRSSLIRMCNDRSSSLSVKQHSSFCNRRREIMFQRDFKIRTRNFMGQWIACTNVTQRCYDLRGNFLVEPPDRFWTKVLHNSIGWNKCRLLRSMLFPFITLTWDKQCCFCGIKTTLGCSYFSACV